jgi:two-component system LytT family response regulator
MQPIKVLIVDDEPAARACIRVLLKTHPDFALIGECEDGFQALEAIGKTSPDLVFLDIQMPEMTGFGVLEALPGPTLPHFVFVTAFDQHAIRAFDCNALDYLLKPYADARFYQALTKARQAIEAARSHQQAGQIGQLLRMIGPAARENTPLPASYLKKLTVKHGGRIQLIPTEQVYYVESEGSFVKLHTAQGMQLASYTCKQLEGLLDPRKFIRVHKSYLVNVDQIESLEPHFHGDYLIYLRNGTQLRLSRNFRDKLGLILNQFQ